MTLDIKTKGMTAAKAVFARRHVIICIVAVAAIAFVIWKMLPMIPRTAKPERYNVGELSLQAITEVVGYRKVTSVSQSLSGTGRAESGSYSYKAGKTPLSDIESYLALLTSEYSAELLPESTKGATEGKLLLTLPSSKEATVITMEIAYSPESYDITVGEKLVIGDKPESEYPVTVTPDDATNLVMSLTKKETGLKSDISVYTTTLEDGTVNVDGWDYYVFNVVADYSATRIEHRATYYVGCYDGVILSYDKESDTTSRIRGAVGSEEKQETTE